MQKSHIQLKEIIWEITGKCLNKCSYCGSKEVWNEEIDEYTIRKVASQICEYPPLEINVSGGDPLLVPYDIHKDIVEKFKEKNIICKILINPKTFINNDCAELMDLYINILKLYDVIGISINDVKDLSFIKNNAKIDDLTFTVITNFNTNNIFLYDSIEGYVHFKDFVWQVQYTVFKDKGNESAIYNNDEALKYLKDKLRNSVKNSIRLVMADNMNSGKCTAGLYSIGILSDGRVVPCLSYRSWVSNDINEYSQGNIKRTPLKDIWEQEFEDYRFNEFGSCKDFCNNKPLDCLFDEENRLTREEVQKLIDDAIEKKLPLPYIYPEPSKQGDTITVYYGVSREGVYAYAVTGKETYVYAVWSDIVSATELKTTTSSDDTFIYKDNKIDKIDKK